MSNYFIYHTTYKKKNRDVSATVIFTEKKKLDLERIKSEITEFYNYHYQTDEIFIIGGEYATEELLRVFIEKQEEVFKGIPKKQDFNFTKGIYVCTFGINGKIKVIGRDEGKTEKFFNKIVHNGLQKIFISKGGLIESQGTHHFVFPSGKHCDKFLRTGNILINGTEIYFIAVNLLKHYDKEIHTQIYCDTSSINSLAFTLVELKYRFADRREIPEVSFESFSSYDGLYNDVKLYGKNALIIISASTSANIINKILERNNLIDRGNIVLLYFLGKYSTYLNVQDKVLCNLTFDKSENPDGIESYETFNDLKCDFCDKGSVAVKVSGDVFLLENPKIELVTITKTQSPHYLSDMLKEFIAWKDGNQKIFKLNYKDNSQKPYDIYIDFVNLIDGVNKGEYIDYAKKLNKYIDQFVPGNLHFIICLDDPGSKSLGQYIYKRIENNYLKKKRPKLINIHSISEHLKNNALSNGSVLVVASCLTWGKNFLFISRALRNFSNYQIVYFTGLTRFENQKQLNFIKSNICYGEYEANTYNFVSVRNIFCDNTFGSGTCSLEIEFLSKIIENLSSEEIEDTVELDFFKKRKTFLQKSFDKGIRGLSDGIFYPVFGSNKELKLRKNFAFFDFDNYTEAVSQAEVYFCISSILNSLRSSNSLHQEVHQRSLISPVNFSRFNDGIIQASLIRAAKKEELNYEIDEQASAEMMKILKSIIGNNDNDQGEGLLEFIYAFALKKIILSPKMMLELKNELEENSIQLKPIAKTLISNIVFEKPKDDVILAN